MGGCSTLIFCPKGISRHVFFKDMKLFCLKFCEIARKYGVVFGYVVHEVVYLGLNIIALGPRLNILLDAL